MKKIFCILGIAALLFGTVGCKKDPKIDVNDITEDGVYVIGEATGATAVSAIYGMAKGHNEAKGNELRDGMYEKYIVLEGGKDFSLVYVTGGKQTAYGATLTEFAPTDFSGIYQDNPATAVLKGALVIGEKAPKMRVSTTGLYHIVLDLNLADDLDAAQIVVSPVQYGVRGGMNSWGFTALEATAPKNDGITYTLTGQELGNNGEFKFAYNGGWKITLDAAGEVKANTNLGADGIPGGSNIVVTEGAGKYKITLTFKLAAGDVKNSWKYAIEQESKASYPENVYMIGAAFGAWDWASEGVVDLPHISAGGDPKDGCFVVTRYFKADDGFKFSTAKDWGKAFGSMTTNPENVTWDTDGNIHVPADGLWTITLDYTTDTMTLTEGMIYGMGPCFNGDWTTAKYAGEVNADGTASITTLSAGALRVYAPCAFDWWQHEFQPTEDGKIEYRTGGELAAFNVEAGTVVTFDFNAGTVTVSLTVGSFTPAITVDGDMSDWAGIAAFASSQNSRIREWKFTSDSKNVYFQFKMRKNRAYYKPLVMGFNTDNDEPTGSSYDSGKINGLEAIVTAYPFTNASSGVAPVPVSGLDENSKVEFAGASTKSIVSVASYDEGASISDDASNIYVELSIPRSAMNLASGSITVGCAFDYYVTGTQSVTVE
jgi:hypothetical protein